MNRLRRSLHFVPGGNQRMLDKALGLAADALILDLEDAVTPERKVAVRGEVCQWLSSTDFGKQERLVRINSLDSLWGADDLVALMRNPPDGIVLPKVRDLKDVEVVHELLTDLELEADLAPGTVPLVLIGTEVPVAVFNLLPMASHSRVNGMAWGAEDLSASLGARTRRDEYGDYLEVFSVTRSLCLLASVAAGIQPIDAVYTDIRDTEGLERECQRAADQGFTGKITIHPDQIEDVNRAFTPTAEEVADAQALLDAFTDNRAAGRMAFTFQGQMVDVPHLKRAEAILLRAGKQLEK